MSTSEHQAAFATTLWSVVLAAGETPSPQSQLALEQLCRTYWFPLYAWLRRRGHSSPDAQDLVQDLFARLIERRGLRGVAPARGRFRSYMIACLNHLVADTLERAQAQKRGGGATLLSLDAEAADQLYQPEASKALSADQLFDRRWAVAVLDQALDQLRAEHLAAGKRSTFETLKPFLTETSAAGDYSAAAGLLGLTPNAVAVTVNRLRTRYRELVRLEIAATVDNPAEVDAEMRDLLAAMRGG
jgi:RNA polymerase sigma factor (sigma-70 family)